MTTDAAEIVFLCGFAVFLAFLFGVLVGTSGERRAWTVRADGDTPHHCEGEFYAVLTERNFLENYKRVTEPSHDASAG